MVDGVVTDLKRGVFVASVVVARLDLEVVFDRELCVGSVDAVGTELAVSPVVVAPVGRGLVTRLGVVELGRGADEL